jgi:hypothetical protein
VIYFFFLIGEDCEDWGQSLGMVLESGLEMNTGKYMMHMLLIKRSFDWLSVSESISSLYYELFW